MPARKVLILGGTREAAELARRFHDSGEWDVTTSLAGRTKDPAPLPGHIRIGGFGGAAGLAAFIRDAGFEKVIDATHPFAKRISANAVEACRAAGVPLAIHTRPGWEKQPDDHWMKVNSLEAAAKALPRGARVFLALGRQYLGAFEPRTDCHFVVRMVDEPEKRLGFASYEVIAARPSLDEREEEALLRSHRITHLVCRNSGGEGGYAKIAAARGLGLPVVMVERTTI